MGTSWGIDAYICLYGNGMDWLGDFNENHGHMMDLIFGDNLDPKQPQQPGDRRNG